MPSSTVKIAWAVEVQVDVFGAHLQAYHKLQPTFSALRLCNRFGTGDKVTVTRLPIELIHRIENHLLCDKQAKLRPKWAKDFRCFELRCTPIEHLSDDDIRDMYAELRGSMCGGSEDDDDDDRSDCSNCGRHETLLKPMKEFVSAVLEEVWVMSECNHHWQEAHETAAESWMERVGVPAGSHSGRSTAMLLTLSKHFGLANWITHAHDEHRDAEYSTNTLVRSTRAWLRLPDKTLCDHEWPDGIQFSQFGITCDPTEVGFGTALDMPTTPSTKSLARFPRAIRALNLQSALLPPAEHVGKGAEEDVEKGAEDAGKGAEEAGKGEADITLETASEESRVTPRLTIFVQNTDKTEW